MLCPGLCTLRERLQPRGRDGGCTRSSTGWVLLRPAAPALPGQVDRTAEALRRLLGMVDGRTALGHLISRSASILPPSLTLMVLAPRHSTAETISPCRAFLRSRRTIGCWGGTRPSLGQELLGPSALAARNSALNAVAIGAHARWDCPLRYIAQCGYCPGFIHEGLRLRSAWHDDDTMPKETVEAR